MLFEVCKHFAIAHVSNVTSKISTKAKLRELSTFWMLWFYYYNVRLHSIRHLYQLLPFLLITISSYYYTDMIINNCGSKLSQNCQIMVTKKKKKMWRKIYWRKLIFKLPSIISMVQSLSIKKILSNSLEVI